MYIDLLTTPTELQLYNYQASSLKKCVCACVRARVRVTFDNIQQINKKYKFVLKPSIATTAESLIFLARRSRGIVAPKMTGGPFLRIQSMFARIVFGSERTS